MRATFLPILALLAFACQPPACRAQATESGTTTPTTTQGGGKTDDALSPSTLPKQRQGVKEEPGTARINTLSPDEERRLERTRARSRDAAKETPRPAEDHHAAGPPPASKAERAPPAKAAATPVASPRREEAPVRKQAERAVHRDRRVSRAARPSRDTAALDGRDRARPTRRASDDRRGGAPRVGDVVPPGVALYPLPPGYGPPRYARPLPFPRSRDEADDDDGPPPPRRAFVEPY